MLLDNLLFRIFNNPNTSYGAMNAITAAMGSFYNWWIFLEHCPEMNKILLFDASWFSNGVIQYNPLYNDDAAGCVHYSNNYFKHASSPHAFLFPLLSPLH